MKNKKNIILSNLFGWFFISFSLYFNRKAENEVEYKFECQTITWLLDEDIAPQIRFSILWLIIHP